jgi:hypothetical protein
MCSTSNAPSNSLSEKIDVSTRNQDWKKEKNYYGNDVVTHSKQEITGKSRIRDRLKFFLFGFSTAIVTIFGIAATLFLVVNTSVSVSTACRITQEHGKQKRRIFPFWKRSQRGDHAAEPICSDPKRQPTQECACQHVCDWLQDVLSSMFTVHQEKGKTRIPTQDTAAARKISTASDSTHQRSKSEFPTAFTPQVIQLSTKEQRLVKELGRETIRFLPDLEERSKHVPWGGLRRNTGQQHTKWWAPGSPFVKGSTPLEQLDGGNLLFSYLRIMSWPEDLSLTHFPYKLCKKHGCPASFALNHTLTFRENYQPWLVTPSMKTVNSKGLVYHQGFSPSLDGEHAPHAIVFLRPALVQSVDDVFYARTVIRELELAVTMSMEESKGRVGKFNVVVSGRGVSFGMMPSLKGIKTFITILQDHYVDRLGVVLLTDMGKICQTLLKLVLPLITEEVRNKIIVVQNNVIERHGILNTVLGAHNVPEWLGGNNSYVFDVDDYYASDDVIHGTDLEAKET